MDCRSSIYPHAAAVFQEQVDKMWADVSSTAWHQHPPRYDCSRGNKLRLTLDQCSAHSLSQLVPPWETVDTV